MPSVCCQYYTFTTNTLLHIHYKCNLTTYVTLVEFVKVFETANYTLIMTIVKQCKAPPKLYSATERIYNALIVSFRLGQIFTVLEQVVSVRQWECTGEVLFFFVINVTTH